MTHNVLFVGPKDPSFRYKGIPLDAGHNPLYKTLVICQNRSDYYMFCQACNVSDYNRQLNCIAWSESNYHADLMLRKYESPGAQNLEMVFLGCDPRKTYLGNIAWALDHLRAVGVVRKAYIFNQWSSLDIEPFLVMEEGREW